MGHDEGIVDFLHGGGDGHVHRLGARPGNEGLEGAQHQHVAGGGDGADAVAVGGGAVKDRKVLLVQPRDGLNVGGAIDDGQFIRRQHGHVGRVADIGHLFLNLAAGFRAGEQAAPREAHGSGLVVAGVHDELVHDGVHIPLERGNQAVQAGHFQGGFIDEVFRIAQGAQAFQGQAVEHFQGASARKLLPFHQRVIRFNGGGAFIITA